MYNQQLTVKISDLFWVVWAWLYFLEGRGRRSRWYETKICISYQVSLTTYKKQKKKFTVLRLSKTLSYITW